MNETAWMNNKKRKKNTVFHQWEKKKDSNEEEDLFVTCEASRVHLSLLRRHDSQENL